MALVELNQISKSYDGNAFAVKHLDLRCNDGEMIALLGPSGCGKTSTLKMIAGLESPTSGTIQFNGQDVTALTSAQRNIAMVFEDYALYSHLSVFENIAFPLRVKKHKNPDIQRIVTQMLELLRLQDIRDVQVNTLSGGAQQRVSIGRALVRHPEVMLFDEPLSHLDADQRVQLRTEIKRLQIMNGLTSVLVTHDQTEAISMADVVAVMNGGVLAQVDTPQGIYDSPNNLFVAGFIGEPPMNFIEATLPWDSKQTVILGIRPEHIGLSNTNTSKTESQLLLHAQITDVEPLGDRDVLTLISALPSQSGHLLMEVQGPSKLAAGSHVSVTIAAQKIHVFESKTQKNMNLKPHAIQSIWAQWS
jgi:ABC-type sugar transport system ATPase subunit